MIPVPGEVVIGSVSVKVVPDLTDFRRELKRDLDQVEKTLPDVEVGLEANTAGFRKKVKEAVREAEATAPDIEVDVDINYRSAMRAIAKVDQAVRAAKASINVGVKVPKVRTFLKTFNRELKAEGGLGVDLKPILDKASYAKFRNDLAAKMRDKRLGIRPVLDRTAKATLMAEIAYLVRPEVKRIFVKVNQASAIAAGKALSRISGLRMLYDLHMEKFKVLANFDRYAPKIASVALALATLSTYLASAAGNVLSLANGIAAIVPGLLALPGMFAGLAAAVWVTKTAFADFNKVLPGFKSSMDELRAAVSANFWKKAQAPIQEFLTKIFPQFATGMRKLATETGGYVGAMAKAMQKELDGRVEGALGNVSKAMQIMSKSAADTARWVRILLETGLKQLPAFAGWWNKINKQFAEFMTNASNSGQLQQWIDTAVKNLQHLGSIVVNLGKVFWNLGKIMEASGASTLASLDKTMQRAAEITSSPAFVSGLTRVMTSVFGTIDTIGKAIEGRIGALATALSTSIPLALESIGGPLGKVLAGLLDGLAGEQFQEGFLQMFEGIGTALNSLAPVMDTLAGKLGIVFGLVGDVVAQMGPLLATFIDEIAGMLETIGPALSSALGVIGPAMGGMFETLGPVFTLLAEVFASLLDAVGPLVAQLASGLGPVLSQIGQDVGGALLKAIEVIKPFLPQIADAIIQIVDAIGPLVGLLADGIVEVLKIAMPIITEIVKGIAKLVSTIAPLVSAALPMLIEIIKFIVQIVGDAVVGVINGIQNIVEGVISVIKGIWEFFAGIFTGDFGRMWEGIKMIFSGAWQAIVGALQVWWNVGILGFLRKGLTVLKAFWGGMWNGIKAFAIAVWNGIKTAVGGAWNFVKNLITNGLGALRGAWSSAWTTIRLVLSSAWEGIKTAVSNGISAVVTFFRELPGKIVSALSGLKDNLLEVGRNAIQGFIDGIGRAKDLVVAKAKEIANALPDWIKSVLNIQSPSRVMRDIGAYAIEGLVRGIASGADGVVSQAQDIAKSLAAVPMELAPVDISAIEDMSLARGSIRSGIANGAGAVAPVYNINTEINGSDLSATDVAQEILWATRRVNGGGVYGPRV